MVIPTAFTLLTLLLWLPLYGSFPRVETGFDKLARPSEAPRVGSEGIVEGVNLITGHYHAHAVDSTLQGIDPITVERFYLRDPDRGDDAYIDLDAPNILGWYFFYDVQIWYDGYSSGEGVSHSVAANLHTGGQTHYERNRCEGAFRPATYTGFTNTGSGILSGQHHPKNSSVVYEGKKNFTHYHSDGTVRHFSGKYPFRDEGTVFAAGLIFERLPSGNIRRLGPEYSHTTLSSDQKIVLNWVKVKLPWMWSPMTLTTSDQRTFVFHPGHDVRRAEKFFNLIKHIDRPDGQRITYHYHDNRVTGNDLMYGIDEPEGRYKRIHYSKQKKVSSLAGPIGSDRSERTQYSFHYAENATDVYDALNHRTRYEYNKDKRITRVTHFIGQSPYRIEENKWDLEGCLLSKRLLDASGKLYLERSFSYDNRGNVTTESLSGPGGSYTKHYTYSSDRFNLLTSETDTIATTQYVYYPETNLIQWKIVSAEGNVRLRQYREYDVCKALTLLVEEDGPIPTFRKITRIQNRFSTPGVGQPEIKEEKYYDFEKGQELLLTRTVYHYDSHNQCIQEDLYDANGLFAYSLRRSYDAMGRCTVETDPLGNSITRSYDFNGNLIKQIGPTPGVIIEHGYDYSNRLLWTRQSDVHGTCETIRYRYDLCGRKIAEIDPSGNETLFEYDELGREVKVSYPPTLDAHHGHVRHTLTKKYDVADNLIEWSDEIGHTHQASYTFRGQPMSQKDLATGMEEFFTYDPRGNLIKKTSADGAYQSIKYDFLDRVIEHERGTLGEGRLVSTHSEYTSFFLISTTDGEGVTTFLDYDGAGREKRIRIGEKIIEKEYDTLGYLSLLCESNHVIHRFINDPQGHVLEHTQEDHDGKLHSKRCYAYDAEGRCTQAKEFLSSSSTATTFFTYDALGREIARQDPLGNTWRTHYQTGQSDRYGVLGTLETTRDPIGREKTRFLDGRGRCLEISQSGRVTQMRYDGSGNLLLEQTEQIPGKWHTVLYTYTPSGQLESIIAPEGHVKARFTYNAHDQLIQKTTPLTQHTFIYDAVGNLKTHEALSSSERIVLHYTYDRNGRVTKLTQNGCETERKYDAHGNVLYEKQESGAILTYTYDPLSRRTRMRLPDGSSVDYQYEGPYLKKVSRLNAAAKELYSHTYTERDLQGRILTSQLAGKAGTSKRQYDLVGNTTLIESSNWKQSALYSPLGEILELTTQDPAGSNKTLFAYDGLSQLIGENKNSYQYDGLGNPSGAEIGPSNQLLSHRGKSYSYDAEGRLAEGCKYDPLDRMTAYKNTTYAHDGFNRRIKRNSNTWYLYDGNREIGTLDRSGKITELRVLGEGVGAEIGATVAIEGDKGWHATLCDLRGSIACARDLKSGKINECYRYTAFGKVSHFATNGVETTYSMISNSWLFCSKRHDFESGWVFFGRRSYDPEMGRFTTPDPLSYKDGPNLYTFAHNNPLSHKDLYGYYDRYEEHDHRSCTSFFYDIFTHIMSAIEWIGKNLIPLPGLRDVVESIGRWGGGGKLLQVSEYRTSHTQAYTIEGYKIPGYTIAYHNGVHNNFEEAKARAQKISEHYGGVQVILLYNSTHGLMSDLLECILLKIGLISPPEKLIVKHIRHTLQNSPDEMITIHAHSQGGLHLYNSARLLTKEERDQIEALTYGSAKILPRDLFGKVMNYISKLDFIPLNDIANYVAAAIGNPSHVTFLTPTTYNPHKEHLFLGKTYQSVVAEIGAKFRGHKT